MKRNRSVFLLDLSFDLKKNGLQNLLVALQIALLVWASTLVAGFFVPHVTSIEPDEAGGYYLDATSSNLTEVYLWMDQWFNTMTDQAYIQNFEVIWEALHSQEDFTFYLCQENVAYVTQYGIDTTFAGDSFYAFLGKTVYDSALSTELSQSREEGGSLSVYTMQPDGVARYSYPLKTEAYAMRVFTLDQGAMEHFELAVSSGRLFDADDFATQSTSVETINVLLGSAYADYYQLGDTIDLCTGLGNGVYRATVIGFIQADSSVTVQEYANSNVTVNESLDYAIVLPFTLFEGSNWYRISNAYSETYNHGWGIVPTISESDTIAWLALQKRVQDLFIAADMPSYQMGNISYSMIYFKSNTTQELVIILCLFATAVLFCGYTVFAFLKAKRERARKYYAIQILCGRSPTSILAQSVLMQGFWHLLAAAGVAYWFYQSMGARNMVRVSLGISLGFFAIVALQLAYSQWRLLAQTDFMQHIMEVQDD